MTKNNLQEHLGWILGSRACFPIENGHFAPPASSQSLLETLSAARRNTHSAPKPGIEVDGRNNENGAGCDFQFLQPAIPSQAKRRADSEDMARLQSGPNSSRKSRLLSQTTPDNVHCPTPYSSRLPGSTLRDQYSAAFDGADQGIHAILRIGHSC